MNNQKFRKNNKKLRKNNKITKKKTRKNNKITSKSKKNKYRKRIQKIMKGGGFVKDVYIKIEKIDDKIKYLTKPHVLYPTEEHPTNVEKYLFLFDQILAKNNSNYNIVLTINESFDTELLKLEDFRENKIFYDLLEKYIDLKDGKNIKLLDSEKLLENDNIKKFYICLQCSINRIEFYDINQFEISIRQENFLTFTENPSYRGT